jgi:hypothetical protein
METGLCRQPSLISKTCIVTGTSVSRYNRYHGVRGESILQKIQKLDEPLRYFRQRLTGAGGENFVDLFGRFAAEFSILQPVLSAEGRAGASVFKAYFAVAGVKVS